MARESTMYETERERDRKTERRKVENRVWRRRVNGRCANSRSEQLQAAYNRPNTVKHCRDKELSRGRGWLFDSGSHSAIKILNANRSHKNTQNGYSTVDSFDRLMRIDRAAAAASAAAASTAKCAWQHSAESDPNVEKKTENYSTHQNATTTLSRARETDRASIATRGLARLLEAAKVRRGTACVCLSASFAIQTRGFSG